MKRQATLRIAALLLPALLGWIVLMGEWNRRRDPSAGVEMPVEAQAIRGTSYSGPRLVLSGSIFETQPVKSEQFPAGSEILLKYRRDGENWSFLGARAGRDGQWSPSEVDIPARVHRESYSGALIAHPLLPTDFAVSRATIAGIRSNAHVRLRLRRGALGNVWVESAFQTGDSLGAVAGLVEDSGKETIAFGTSEESLDPRTFATARAEGWVARVASGKIRGMVALPGRPLETTRLSNGTLRMAVHSGAIYGDRGFDLVELGSDLAVRGSPRHFDRFFFSFAPDGSVWSASAPAFQRPREGFRLIHSDSSGTLLAEIPVAASGTVTAVRDDFVVTCGGDAVIRYAIRGGRLEETDRWTVEGPRGALFDTPETLIAAGSKGVFVLTSGQADAKPLFLANSDQSVLAAHADGAGNLVIATVNRVSRQGRFVGGREIVAGHLWFLPKGGPAIDLGDAFESESSNRMTKAQRVVVHEGNLYFATASDILVFDLASKKLKNRIAERESSAPSRIF